MSDAPYHCPGCQSPVALSHFQGCPEAQYPRDKIITTRELYQSDYFQCSRHGWVGPFSHGCAYCERALAARLAEAERLLRGLCERLCEAFGDRPDQYYPEEIEARRFLGLPDSANEGPA